MSHEQAGPACWGVKDHMSPSSPSPQQTESLPRGLVCKLREVTWAKPLARVSGLPHVRTTSGLASVFLAQATGSLRDGISSQIPPSTQNTRPDPVSDTSPDTEVPGGHLKLQLDVRMRRGSLLNAVTLYTVSCDVLCPSHHHASHTHPLCSFIFTAL